MLLMFSGYGVASFIAPTVRTVVAQGRSTDLIAPYRVPDVIAPHRDTDMGMGQRSTTLSVGGRSRDVVTVLPTTTADPPTR